MFLWMWRPTKGVLFFMTAMVQFSPLQAQTWAHPHTHTHKVSIFCKPLWSIKSFTKSIDVKTTDFIRIRASGSHCALTCPVVYYSEVCVPVFGAWVCVFSCEGASPCLCAWERSTAASYVSMFIVSLMVTTYWVKFRTYAFNISSGLMWQMLALII